MIRADEEKATKQKGAVPEVLTALLIALEELYEGVKDDGTSRLEQVAGIGRLELTYITLQQRSASLGSTRSL